MTDRDIALSSKTAFGIALAFRIRLGYRIARVETCLYSPANAGLCNKSNKGHEIIVESYTYCYCYAFGDDPTNAVGFQLICSQSQLRTLTVQQTWMHIFIL